ncbi:MAG: MoaD/ThiS family protein [Cyclobacteriaceae bacterium]
MKIELIAFGIARDIVGTGKLVMNIKDSGTVRDVRLELLATFKDFEKLASLKLAVNADYVEDDFQLSPNDEVVIIPPVSGG